MPSWTRRFSRKPHRETFKPGEPTPSSRVRPRLSRSQLHLGTSGMQDARPTALHTTSYGSNRQGERQTRQLQPVSRSRPSKSTHDPPRQLECTIGCIACFTSDRSRIAQLVIAPTAPSRTRAWPMFLKSMMADPRDEPLQVVALVLANPSAKTYRSK